MSKAKNLGAGSSFAQARPISARRAAIGAATGAPTSGVPDPTELPLGLISQNPDNPREELRDLEGLADSVREIGVINAITVATIDAYLAERPDRADDLDEGARYIVIDGHRRLEASRLAGVPTIRVSVDNALVSTDESLLEAAFVANVHRDDMNPLEQAQALRKLVDFYGSQSKAAKRLGIAQSTISSKLSILDLSPELQADLLAGRRKIEHVRNLSKLPPEEQRQQADARAAASDRQRRQPGADLSRRDTSDPSNTAVSATGGAAPSIDGLSRRETAGNESAKAREGSGTIGLSTGDLSRRDSPLSKPTASPTAVNGAPGEAVAPSRRDKPGMRDQAQAQGDNLPAPRSEASDVLAQSPGSAEPAPGQSGVMDLRRVIRMPWHDGNQVADLVLEKMHEDQRKVLIERLLAEDSDSRLE
ncbi:ParB/RepB/Spo0J family partition protein [Streptomyces sp. NPDC050856]|uniref:ParB/RepB/Spo0J family partition protein n=1 Tax=Streptomyces sp. NPDC050856 TaxID=3154939 RepID=UPI0033F1B1F4